MSKIFDLRPSKSLINSDFEKYQFSADTVPEICEKKLETEVFRLELNSNQDSWLEAKVFAYHNHLIKNPYNDSCLFIDNNGGIWQFESNEYLNLLCTSKSIGTKSNDRVYNPSIAFASETIFAVCDGGSSLEFFIDVDQSINSVIIDDVGPAIIFDACLVEKTSRIIVSLYKIEEENGKKISRLVFLTYDYCPNTTELFKLYQKQILKVKGSIEHVYIEKNGEACHVISQNQIEFEYDSLNPIKKENPKVDIEVKIPKYCWSQDEDSLTLYVKIPAQPKDVTPKIDTKPTSISITSGDIVILSGEMHHRLESELTTWKLKDDTLEIELTKSETGLMWSEFIKNNTDGEYLPNQTLAAEIHSKLSHLCSEQEAQDQPTIGFNSEQLEECDLSGADNFFQCIDMTTHSIVHMAMLSSSNRVIFTEKQRSSYNVCIRYDHDGCIWKFEDGNNSAVNMQHIHTFPAFGYVEASKTNKKFCVAPLDASYAAIVEHAKRALIYEKPPITARVAKQRLLDFGSNDSSVLGAVAVNKYLIILTKDILYQLKIYS